MTFVKRMAGGAALGAAMLIGVSLCAPPAQAAYVVDLEQVGSNVVATGSGTLDLTGLSAYCLGCGTGSATIDPSQGILATGPTSNSSFDVYGAFTGPASFGSGGYTSASSGSGDPVAIDDAESYLYVPEGYVSDSALSDSATWDTATFASLGVTPGTYEWTWGTGPDQNFTLNIGTAAAPEPSALALLALPLGLVMLFAARSRRTSRSAALS